MKDLRKLILAEAQGELYEEVRTRMATKLSFNIFGELKTYVKIEVFRELRMEYPYLDEFESLFGEVWDRVLVELSDGKY